MFGDAAERVCQPTGRTRAAASIVATVRDHGALGGLFHAGMTFPAPAVTADLVAARNRVPAGKPGRALERAAAGAQRGRRAAAASASMTRHQPARVPYSKCFLHAAVGQADDLVGDLVDRLVALVAVRSAELGALLDIDHDRDRDARAWARRHPAVDRHNRENHGFASRR